MTAWTAASGASLLAHGVHWTIVLGGTAGMVALVLPSALDRLAPGLAPRLNPAPATPRDEHERRVHEVRQRLAAGAPSGVPTATPFFLAGAAARRPRPAPSYDARLTAPLALVAALAAAGVHAAVGAAHLAAQPLLGAFFLACGLAQLAWAAHALQGPSVGSVRAALLGNAGLVAVWLASRTTGLPGVPGLGEPEPVGAWDLLAVGWQLVLVAACARLLARGATATRPAAAAAWREWQPAARWFLLGSALVLALTSTSGVAA
ncbi:hypothetical protein GGQ22_17405 [Nocardioides sp. zg-579]|uniref:Uncharacterized protein n=1 Tax=Nocardioides marmotae TaxID=2663857 RepID=A0A6I3JF31_9ACTN|nr:hypothetical protein [Nocardioides marmotae]MCR6033201.1 hypothetical protein [Gordonia jinghuaiqii]MTB96856.1 hypothetical protein [Nocardioides marmotae]QKE02948.1 hypothetical protein HPC71_19205 [Nocardioides marmotae]